MKLASMDDALLYSVVFIIVGGYAFVELLDWLGVR
jgi:hypothetical protein